MQISKVSSMCFQGIKQSAAQKLKETATKTMDYSGVNFNEFAYSVPTGTPKAETIAKKVENKVTNYYPFGSPIKNSTENNTQYKYISASMPLK